MASIFAQVFSDKYTTNMTDDNSFLSYFSDLSPYIIEKGEAIRIPQITFKPQVLKGLTTNNAFTSQATTETEQILSLTRYYITPIEINNYETMYSVYDKISGLATNAANEVADTISTDVLINTAKQIDTSRFLSTTGSAGTGNSPSGGNKKMIRLQDVANIATAMDIDKVAKKDRYLMISPRQWNELKFSTDNIQYQRYDYGQTGLDTAIVGNIAGINILTRAEVPVWDGTSGILPQDSSYDANDTFLGVAWQKDHVGFALGRMKADVEYNQVKYANLLTFENYMLAGSLRESTKRIGLYGLKQG